MYVVRYVMIFTWASMSQGARCGDVKHVEIEWDFEQISKTGDTSTGEENMHHLRTDSVVSVMSQC